MAQLTLHVRLLDRVFRVKVASDSTVQALKGRLSSRALTGLEPTAMTLLLRGRLLQDFRSWAEYGAVHRLDENEIIVVAETRECCGVHVPVEFLSLAKAIDPLSDESRTKRIQRELEAIMLLPECSLQGVDDETVLVRVVAPRESPYYRGMFHLELQMSGEFPAKPPSARVLTPMHSLHVMADGTLDLALLHARWWRMEYMLADVIQGFRHVLEFPTVHRHGTHVRECRQSAARVQQYQASVAEYYRDARAKTAQFATQTVFSPLAAHVAPSPPLAPPEHASDACCEEAPVCDAGACFAVAAALSAESSTAEVWSATANDLDAPCEHDEVVKVRLGDDVRRVRVPAGTPFRAFKELLLGRFVLSGDTALAYRDDENDLVVVTCDVELNEARRHAVSGGALHLMVV